VSILSYGDVPSQESSSKMYPSKGAPQFKTAPTPPFSMQSGKLLAHGQYYSTLGGASSREVSQFKTPLLTLRSDVQSSKLQAQDRFYSASGVPPFNKAPLFPVTDSLQSIVQQPEKWVEQSGYHPSSGIYLSNSALQHTRPTMSLPRCLALPSISARGTCSADEMITNKSGVLPTYLNISANSYIDTPASHSSLKIQRQRQSPPFLRESDLSWQPTLPRTEARVRPKALHRTKVQVTIRLILMAGTVLLVGGIASFLLLHFPTYLVVTWAILIIVFSNLASRELRSYYQLTPTMRRTEAVYPSTISPPHGEDMERHPMLKDISDTTGYLKALSLVFKNGHPAQTSPSEKGYKV
jgi:hypothetical protein